MRACRALGGPDVQAYASMGRGFVDALCPDAVLQTRGWRGEHCLGLSCLICLPWCLVGACGEGSLTMAVMKRMS